MKADGKPRNSQDERAGDGVSQLSGQATGRDARPNLRAGLGRCDKRAAFHRIWNWWLRRAIIEDIYREWLRELTGRKTY